MSKQGPTYRKTHIKMWDDPRYTGLSLGARNLWQIVTQGKPSCVIPGLAVAPGEFVTLARELGSDITAAQAEAYWKEIEGSGLKVRRDGPLIFCPDYALDDLRSGGTNPSVVRGLWKRPWDEAPNVPLKAQVRRFFLEHFEGYDRERAAESERKGKEPPAESYADAFEETCAEPSREDGRRRGLLATLGLDEESREASPGFDAS